MMVSGMKAGKAIRKAVDNAKYNLIKVRRGYGDVYCYDKSAVEGCEISENYFGCLMK